MEGPIKKMLLSGNKNQRLEAIQERCKNLTFWQQVKTSKNSFTLEVLKGIVLATSVLPGMNVNYKFGKWLFADNESEKEKPEAEMVPFPSGSPQVYHFHPTAFVEQMRKIEEELVFPFKSIPLNHPQGFKTAAYKEYDYTVHEENAATFGNKRGSVRIHAGRDLYAEVGEPVNAIADGVVITVSFYYDNTWQITIEHDYQIKKGYNILVVYGEVDKDNILVKQGEKVKQGQQIGKVGLLYDSKKKSFVEQPAGEKRGMLHFEMYTGEDSGNISSDETQYSEMMYAKSDNYHTNRSFQRRKDLIDPLPYLDKMIKNL